MTIENQRDLDGILAIGRIVAEIRDAMLAAVKPGMTTAELDEMGGQMLSRLGAISAPMKCYDFPGFTCISVNEEAAHGVPGARVIGEGDIVNVDVSAERDGYFADTGGTMVVAPVADGKATLCKATELALARALAEVRTGAAINQVGKAIEDVAKTHRLKIIRNLAGHGLGRSLHEEPEGILGFYDRGDRRFFEYGQVVAIEPFLSTRSSYVSETDDGWTLVGDPASRSAQFEHTVIVTDGAPIVATRSQTAA
ncbi:methionine aminopeptidase [Salinisphaera sp. T5B8]|uniref:type I methionyl aminopeptidase n=1 Tax=Salinisphaera sp. T5B8 TaxID=1304154 RepID=UPI00334248B8